MNSTTEINKKIVRRFYEEVFNQRNTEVIAEFMAATFINYDPTPVAARNRESMQQLYQNLDDGIPRSSSRNQVFNCRRG